MSSVPNPDITVDVNLRNPGQFFACCGLFELASRLWPGSEANGWREPAAWFARGTAGSTFHITAHSAKTDPLLTIIGALVAEQSPFELSDDQELYAADRQPVIVRAPFGGGDLRLDWWLESYRGGDKSELKVWAGQQTPMRNFDGLRAALGALVAAGGVGVVGDRALLSKRAPMTGRFGFDPSASPNALDVGFSTDEQRLPVQTAPASELLAAIGLQRARPVRDERARGRWFRYRAWSEPLAIGVIPAAMAGVGRAVEACVFPVFMRNSQYGNFGWAKRWEEEE